MRRASLAFVVLLPALAGAQSGRTAPVLLVLPGDTRAAAMANAGAAGGDDERSAAALFYNPARLPGAAAATLSTARWLGGATLASAAGAARLGRGTAAIGVRSLVYGDAAEIVPDPASGGVTGVETGATVSASELAITAGYALTTGRLRTGLAGSWISQRVAGLSGTAAALDAGATVQLAHGAWGALAGGGAVQSAGGALTTGAESAPLPRTVRAGVALEQAPALRARWQLATELVAVRDERAALRAGVEGEWRAGDAARLLVRAGVTTRDAGARGAPITLGGGVGGAHLALDYAWRRFGALGDTHRVGVRWWR